MNKIYLDQASTSFPKAPSVAQAVYDYLAGLCCECEPGRIPGSLFCGRTDF